MRLLRGVIASLFVAIVTLPLATTIEKTIAAEEAVFEDEQSGALPASVSPQSRQAPSDTAVFEDEEQMASKEPTSNVVTEPQKAVADQARNIAPTSAPIQRPASPRTMNSAGLLAALPLLILAPIGFSVFTFSKPTRKKRS